MTQFALPLAWPANPREGEFVVSTSNAAAIRMLERWAGWPVFTAILAGPPGSGRSTLARIFADRTGAQVIDDAERESEERLFHAWNLAQAERRPLLLVAAAPPPTWPVTLPDLRSRLGASPVAQIEPPDDRLIELLLARGFERHHLDARPELIAWLATRLERSHAAIAEVVERLAVAANETQRRLSIRMARETLADVATLTSRSVHE